MVLGRERDENSQGHPSSKALWRNLILSEGVGPFSLPSHQRAECPSEAAQEWTGLGACSDERDPVSRWGDCYGGFTCLFSLYRMAGEYPNFVSLCKYLHVLVCLWLPYQEPR